MLAAVKTRAVAINTSKKGDMYFSEGGYAMSRRTATGVTLIGIACQNCPLPIRQEILSKLANEWRLDQLEAFCDEIPLSQLSDTIQRMLQGRHSGRTIINLDD